MKKKHIIVNTGTATDVKKTYILTRPAKLSEISFDELERDDTSAGWREKSRQLQAKRWRKIRHQLA